MWLRAISQNVCGVGVGPTGRIHQEPFGNMHFTCVGIVTCIRATAALKVQIGKSLRKKSQKKKGPIGLATTRPSQSVKVE